MVRDKKITFAFVLLALLIGTYNQTASAQWDLGGMSAGQGQGNLGVGLGNQLTAPGGAPMQPYAQPNAVPYHQMQTMYQNNGSLINPNSGLPVGSVPNPLQPAAGGGGRLPTTNMPWMSRIQLPSNLKGVRIVPNTGVLPPTTLDSFVRNAGGAASRIYGDEGTNWIPPQNGFPLSSSINAGISHSPDNKTLTTGHSDKLPSPSQVNIHSGAGVLTKSGAR